ncbi:hypothetical protein BEWA_054670 [Theileria equi strain WA]|uniref:Uncharacterized protein n=1 Tax=Theileria equi strain WA TaxID=1537102 RepID=L1LDI4_THEEQ|nr:hypothetical protein BEWA_054670 [Theileria equi strain WA]EKX73411.1 hypothetical protein BEWA_054670 [Theileria equi strain WA]|eukprot:XP_004832863.1 hypothetical protein BEWA_054670 [Theileria equi strain WA]
MIDLTILRAWSGLCQLYVNTRGASEAKDSVQHAVMSQDGRDEMCLSGEFVAAPFIVYGERENGGRKKNEMCGGRDSSVYLYHPFFSFFSFTHEFSLQYIASIVGLQAQKKRLKMANV